MHYAVTGCGFAMFVLPLMTSLVNTSSGEEIKSTNCIKRALVQVIQCLDLCESNLRTFFSVSLDQGWAMCYRNFTFLCLT
jgi:hypothetical protein